MNIEALRLADRLNFYALEQPLQSVIDDTIIELRRLHEVNQELINAVLDLLMDTPPCDCEKTDMRCPVQNAKAVLEKSRGNT
jgi:hypothetical protein